MKFSNLGLKSVKLSNLDEMYKGQDILMKTNQIKQYGSGVYAYGHVPYLVLQNINKVIRKHFNRIGSVEIHLPLLQQKEIWEQSGRYDSYINDGVMLSLDSGKGIYCLAPTAEEAVMKYVENTITSYKQLPVYYYQIGDKFRNELRNRGYLYRGKEFLMFDLYSFDKNESDMVVTYQKMRQCYLDIFAELEVNVLPVSACNGSIGGSYSEEMMALSETGEDTILYDEKSNTGLNVELLEENANYLKEHYNITNKEELKKIKAVELGHIFALSDKYSTSMDIKFIDSLGKSKPFYMGCYGIGISRLLGLIYENNVIYKNEQAIGFSLPLSVTPYYLYIIANDLKQEKANSLYLELLKRDISVILDDSNYSMGEKIRNAKVLGIPYLAIMGNNTEDEIELEYTKDDSKVLIKNDDFIKEFLTIIKKG